MRFTEEMKKEFLSIKTGEEYMEFLSQYPVTWKDIAEDKEIADKMTELILQAPGSRQDIPGVHEECFQRKNERPRVCRPLHEMSRCATI